MLWCFQRALYSDRLPKLLLQPALRKAVDKEENYNKWGTPTTRQKTIFHNLDLHCWLNLRCYCADGEKQNKTSLLFRWMDKSSTAESIQRSLMLLYVDSGKGQSSIKPSRAWRKSPLRASLPTLEKPAKKKAIWRVFDGSALPLDGCMRAKVLQKRLMLFWDGMAEVGVYVTHRRHGARLTGWV